MPFETHPQLITPPDDTVLWRYSDFAKFMDLIERRKLWFSRADKFDDPLEGTFTDAEVGHFRSLATRVQAPPDAIADSYLQISRMMRGTVFLNCWREGKHESMAMWDIYGKGSGVVAIKSTVGLLKEAIASHQLPIFIARVNYVDWNVVEFRGNALQICTRKDLSYAHEAEVRAIIWGLAPKPDGTPLFDGNDLTKIPSGVEVDFDPSRFVTEVMVGPREQARIGTLVEAIMKRYGLAQEVKASDRLKGRI